MADDKPRPFSCPRCGATHDAVRVTAGYVYRAKCGEDDVTINMTGIPEGHILPLEQGAITFTKPRTDWPPEGAAWFDMPPPGHEVRWTEHDGKIDPGSVDVVPIDLAVPTSIDEAAGTVTFTTLIAFGEHTMSTDATPEQLAAIVGDLGLPVPGEEQIAAKVRAMLDDRPWCRFCHMPPGLCSCGGGR